LSCRNIWRNALHERLTENTNAWIDLSGHALEPELLIRFPSDESILFEKEYVAFFTRMMNESIERSSRGNSTSILSQQIDDSCLFGSLTSFIGV
jgi:hypothetical protein